MPNTSRRRLLSMAAGTAVGGLAGCLDATLDADPETETPTPTDTSGWEPDTPGEDWISAEEYDCAEELGASMPMDRFDPGDPFVFTVEYPEDWELETLDVEDAAASYDVYVTAPVAVDTGGSLFDVSIRQHVNAVTEDHLDTIWESHWEVVDTVAFDGEERDVIDNGSGDPGRFILITTIPNPATDEYHMVTFDGFTLDFEGECHEGYRELGDAMVQSLEPRS